MPVFYMLTILPEMSYKGMLEFFFLRVSSTIVFYSLKCTFPLVLNVVFRDIMRVFTIDLGLFYKSKSP